MEAEYITLEARNGDMHLIGNPPVGNPPEHPGAIGSNADTSPLYESHTDGTGGSGEFLYINQLQPGVGENLRGSTVDIILDASGIRDNYPAFMTRGIYIATTTVSPDATGNYAAQSLQESGVNVPYNDPRLYDGAIMKIAFPSTGGVCELISVDARNLGTTLEDIANYELELEAYKSSGSQSLSILTNIKGLANKVQQSLKLRRGSCPYDLDAGFPWDKLHGSSNPALMEVILRKHLRGLPFVTDIGSIQIDIDEINRTMSGKFSITTTLNESITITFNTVD